MSVVEVKDSGKFGKTNDFLYSIKDFKKLSTKARLEALAVEGVKSLAEATPKKTGKTASSWSYEIEEKNGKTVINWNNSNVIRGINIAVILQYGHGTKNGGYVHGRDYINPALQSIFDKMASNMWKAVVSS